MLGLAVFVAAVLLVIGAGFFEFATGSNLPAGPLASAMLVVVAAVTMVRRPISGAALWSAVLLAVMVVGNAVALVRGAPFGDAIVATVGILLVPAALVIGSGGSGAVASASYRWLQWIALAQVPFLIANEFGILTPIPVGNPYEEHDRYQGLFVTRGPYLATYVLAVFLAVWALRSRRRGSVVLSIASVIFLAYWTDNKTVYVLAALAVSSAWIYSTVQRQRGTIRVATSVLLSALLVASSVAVALLLPARTWGHWSTVTLENATETVSSVSSGGFMSADDGGCKTDSALITETDAIRAVTDWSGVYWRESIVTLLLGNGASLGMSHRAEQVQAASCVDDVVQRVHFSNPSRSIIGSPPSSFLAILTEFGLVGLLALSMLIGTLVTALWLRKERLSLLVVLAPYAMLWLVTPALESPMLPAVLGMALLAIPDGEGWHREPDVLTSP